MNPLALILLHNLPRITRTFVNSNHFHPSLGGSSYREYTVLVVTETKLDDTFTSAQFYTEGFKTPIRLDSNSFGGGIVIYIRENIPSKFLEQLPSGDNDEGIFVELNLRNSKWILFAGYSPSKEHISPYLKNIEIIMNKFVNDYDNIIMMGDFNCDVDKKHENNKILNFCESFSLTNLL